MVKLGISLMAVAILLGSWGYYFVYVHQSENGADIGAAGALMTAPPIFVLAALMTITGAIRRSK